MTNEPSASPSFWSVVASIFQIAFYPPFARRDARRALIAGQIFKTFRLWVCAVLGLTLCLVFFTVLFQPDNPFRGSILLASGMSYLVICLWYLEIKHPRP